MGGDSECEANGTGDITCTTRTPYRLLARQSTGRGKEQV